MLGAIANACVSQSNFYSVMIHLSRSGRSVLVSFAQRARDFPPRSYKLFGAALQILANFGFLATLFIGRVLQRVFFGPLQPREVEVRRATSPFLPPHFTDHNCR